LTFQIIVELEQMFARIQISPARVKVLIECIVQREKVACSFSKQKCHPRADNRRQIGSLMVMTVKKIVIVNFRKSQLRLDGNWFPTVEENIARLDPLKARI